MKQIIEKIIIALLLSFAFLKPSFIDDYRSNSFSTNYQVSNKCDSSEDCDSTQTRMIYYSDFNGTATNISIGPHYSLYLYPNQYTYLRFLCPSRQCLSFNYVGPSASLKIYYSNFFASGDYLVSVSDVSSAIDCYYFDKDNEYIIELMPTSILYNTVFSMDLESLTTSTLTNHKKYAFHQIFDTSSNVGYHYETVYFDVSETQYTVRECSLHNDGLPASYLNAIDSNHWFFDPAIATLTENRKIVSNSGYDEYSSIAFGEKEQLFNRMIVDYYVGIKPGRFTGTFVSSNVVVSCAHSMFPDYEDKDEETLKVYTGLNRLITFKPGINSYYQNDNYGIYTVNELYSSISYVLELSVTGDYTINCADYDWSVCVTEQTTAGTKTHSCMGISGFSYPSGLEYWSHAMSAGYPHLTTCPEIDRPSFEKALWASFPLENNVTIVGSRIDSTSVIVSKGNSGGPLYHKTSGIQYGQLVKYVYLLGIASSHDPEDVAYVSHFYRITALLVNIVDEIITQIS